MKGRLRERRRGVCISYFYSATHTLHATRPSNGCERCKVSQSSSKCGHADIKKLHECCFCRRRQRLLRRLPIRSARLVHRPSLARVPALHRRQHRNGGKIRAQARTGLSVAAIGALRQSTASDVDVPVICRRRPTRERGGSTRKNAGNSFSSFCSKVDGSMCCELKFYVEL